MQGYDKWKKIEVARKILKLPIRTTRREIIEHYKNLSKIFHPDKGGDEESMKKLNEAYEILMKYCDNYLILLAPNDNISDPEEWWFEHFGEDPIWGKMRNKG
ncbi:MAG: DnaJ domain-containing protein [Thermodesulfobacteriaceae bacterium]|nr:DnaJ domain-containing protein [Thermodesulfobacteriaceae bacterium]MCX8042201.1 DnaJ domain-containing protein [Thermodesulfobacteriaceae bacterium]MDW8136661.1 DnaJ domain-containing protein [Thermodesulfobacterium sp.]